MLMSDVIKVLGNTPLKAFPWGCVVKDTVNLFVDETNRITEDSTGMDVTTALDSLPAEQRDLVLRAKLDPTRRCVATPAGGGMVIEHEGESATLDDTAALRRAVLTPQFMTSAFLVVLPLSMGAIMISNLAAHRDFHWSEFFSAVWKVFGITLGG
ncbi:hypothetical protein D3C87_332240 [compost metagenome]|jgi:hypothetical protein